MWARRGGSAIGDDERPTFAPLVDAMGWVESHDEPTGIVSYLGAAVVQYEQGNVDLAHGNVRATRQRMFILSTEGMTASQMKAEAAEGLQPLLSRLSSSYSIVGHPKPPEAEP